MPRQNIGHRGDGCGDREITHRARGQWSEEWVGRSRELLKEPQEPVGRKPGQHSLMFLRGEFGFRSVGRHHKIHTQDHEESGQLQDTRDLQEQSIAQELRG